MHRHIRRDSASAAGDRPSTSLSKARNGLACISGDDRSRVGITPVKQNLDAGRTAALNVARKPRQHAYDPVHSTSIHVVLHLLLTRRHRRDHEPPGTQELRIQLAALRTVILIHPRNFGRIDVQVRRVAENQQLNQRRKKYACCACAGPRKTCRNSLRIMARRRCLIYCSRDFLP